MMVDGSRLNQASCQVREDMGYIEVFKASYTTYAFSRHWHEGFGIGFIEHGCEVFEYMREKCYAPKCSVVLTNPCVVHTGEAANQNIGWRYRMMYVPPPIFEKVQEELTDRPSGMPYFPLPVITDPDIAGRLLRLLLLLEMSTPLLERQSVFLETVAEIIRRYSTPVQERQPGDIPQLADRIRDYIDCHYMRNISLMELADVAGISRYHLLRVFRNRFGLPPHNYQILKRVLKAKTLLQHGCPTILAAAEAGFADQSHFHRYFKRVMGFSPGEYCLRATE